MHVPLKLGDNLINIQMPNTSLKFLRIQLSGGCWFISCRVKRKYLYCRTSLLRRDSRHLIGLIRFWRYHIPHFRVLFRCIYGVMKKVIRFVGTQSKKPSAEGPWYEAHGSVFQAREIIGSRESYDSELVICGEKISCAWFIENLNVIFIM